MRGEKERKDKHEHAHTHTLTSLGMQSTLGVESCCSSSSVLIGRGLGEACSDWMVKVEYRPDFM